MTFFEASVQSGVFLLLLYAGAAAGILYDLLSLLRRRLPRLLSPLPDLLWCLLCAGLCVCALARGGEGSLRLYAMLGMACGAGIYILGLRRAAAWLLKRGKGLVRRSRERRQAKEAPAKGP